MMDDTDTEKSHRNNSRSPGILHSAGMMLGSSYFQMLLGLVRGVLVMRIIGPTGRGIMQLVGLAHKYLTHSHLGALHGITKLLPAAIGRKDEHDIERIENAGASFVTLSGIIAGIGLAAFGAFSSYGMESRIALMIGGALLVTHQVEAAYRCILRAWGTFSIIAVAGAVMAVGHFGFVVGGATLFDVTGAMFGWLLATILVMVYLWYASNLTVSVQLEKTPILSLIRSGLPIMVVLMSQILLRTVDGLVVWNFFPQRVHQFGLYSVAMQAAKYMYRLPEVGGFIMLPKILEGFARTGAAAGVRTEVMVPTLAAATLMPVIAGAGFIIEPIMIRTIVPKFSPAIFATQILSLGSVLLALPMTSNSLLISQDMELVVAANNGIGAVVSGGGAVWQGLRGGSIGGVALAAVVGYFVASTLSLTLGLRQYYDSNLKVVKQLVICHLPMLWCVGVLKWSGLMIPGPAEGARNWLQVSMRLGLFLALSFPVLVYGNRRTGFLKRFRDKISELLRERKNSGQDDE